MTDGGFANALREPEAGAHEQSYRLAASAAFPLAEPARSTKLTVAGLFAGIGGIEEGFRQAGHSSSMLCEADSLARHVLGRRFPNAELTTDVKALAGLPECDVVTAGFPCQDLSQVGRRAGIGGPNSGLIDSVFGLLRKQGRRQPWLVLENVPFMLSLDKGRGIRTIVDVLEDLGFSWAYRTIDAHAFGLPQRRRRVILLASQTEDPRPVLLGSDATRPASRPRGAHSCGFYWTEGNTGLGWAIDAVPPLKGGSAIHIPSPPAIWFPKRRLIGVPAIEDAERLQGFEAGWTDIDDIEPNGRRKRWRMVGNAVSVRMAKWVAERLSLEPTQYRAEASGGLPNDRGWPSAGWGHGGQRGRSTASEWPVAVEALHLSGFLKRDPRPLSVRATAGFHSRLIRSGLRYEEAFALDLAHHIERMKAG